MLTERVFLETKRAPLRVERLFDMFQQTPMLRALLQDRITAGGDGATAALTAHHLLEAQPER